MLDDEPAQPPSVVQQVDRTPVGEAGDDRAAEPAEPLVHVECAGKGFRRVDEQREPVQGVLDLLVDLETVRSLLRALRDLLRAVRRLLHACGAAPRQGVRVVLFRAHTAPCLCRT
ncbi:hypothetical protein SMICM304S_05211 [Streptomyces microflavus]